MKKAFLFLFAAACFFSSCKKDDDNLFDKSPDERLNEVLASYQSTLTGAENGWKAFITVDNGVGGTYSFYFRFTNENRVRMVSDFDTSSAVTLQESSYRLKAQQQPTLIFDTYSYVHVLADPNESTIDVQSNVNGGPVGQGLLSDFEFIFDNEKIRADTLELTGKVNHSKLVLVRATKEEGDAYAGGQFVLFSNYLYNILTYFKRFTIESTAYDIRVNPQSRSLVISWLDAQGNLQTFSTTYYNILNGIILTQPFMNGGLTINSFTNAVFDAASSTLTVSAGGKQGVISPTVFPLKIDVNAPRAWWQYAIDNGNSFWISVNGFHVNGADDAFGITTLGNYYFLVYWPEYDPGNDLFAPVFINAAGTGLELRYGAAPATPTFTTDGLAKFTLLGNYGTYPSTGPAALSRTQLLIPEGYYFVQTSASSYDMVSAKDGKAWISWEF